MVFKFRNFYYCNFEVFIIVIIPTEKFKILLSIIYSPQITKFSEKKLLRIQLFRIWENFNIEKK